MRPLTALVATVLVFASGIAAASEPSPECSTSQSAACTVVATPEASAPGLTAAGCIVEVFVLDGACAPIWGVSATDIWLDSPTGEVSFCRVGSTADRNTGLAGETTIGRRLGGGGSTTTGLQVYVQGIAIGDILPILVKSPDSDGDLDVDIADLGRFAADLGAGNDAFRSDFNDDGTVDLADLGRFVVSYGETCN